MLGGITPESLEALMFKLTSSANGGTILVTDLDGRPRRWMLDADRLEMTGETTLVG